MTKRPRATAASRRGPGPASGAGAPRARPPFPPLLPPAVARWLALPSALLIALLVHYPALGTFFAQDDLTFLARARGLEPSPVSVGRVLSGPLRWRLFESLFGLDPLPYHAANLLLHLANVALIYAVARRLFAGRGAAWAAAVLFGASAIAFTPLHWATGMGEILATTFALAALLLYLAARGAGVASHDPVPAALPGTAAAAPPARNALLWLSAAAVLAAGLSKETVLLIPLVIVVADRRLGGFAPQARTLVPAGLAGLVFLAGFLATLRSVDYLGGEAYALSFSPAFLAGNLATYLRWCVALADPVRDAVASTDLRAPGVGGVAAVAVVLAIAFQWRAPRHPEEVGAAWFLALLAPVVPLAHHTYLYYLYLPWAGACWLLAGAGERIARRLPLVAPFLLAAVLAVAGTEAWSVRARARALTGTIPADRTVRESTMLRNVTVALDSTALAPGARIAFVNPAPALHSSLAGGRSGPLVSYVPLETALGRGRALALFFPRLRYLGFSDTLPRTWEDADVFLFQDDGRARHLGRGSRALAELGYFTLRTQQWARAESMFRRSLALGDTLPDAVFGLGATRSALGAEDEARRWLAEFLRRWPADERAPAIAAALRTPRTGSAPPPVAR